MVVYWLLLSKSVAVYFKCVTVCSVYKKTVFSYSNTAYSEKAFCFFVSPFAQGLGLWDNHTYGFLVTMNLWGLGPYWIEPQV
jgi:hypothetical protein